MIPISELDLIKIGEILKAHGYKGELVIKLSINFNNLKETELLFLETEGIMVPFFFSSIPKPYKKAGLIAKLANIDSDKEVEDMLHSSVFIPKDFIIEEEEVGFEDFLSFDVYNNEKLIGKAGEYLNIPSNPVLTVISLENKEILIPLVDQFIKLIDHKNKTIIFNLPDGLVDINL